MATSKETKEEGGHGVAALYYPFFPETKKESEKNDAAPLLSRVGGKGLSLIQSSSNGFPVPKGFVLSVDFFQPWIDLCTDDASPSEAWKAFREKATALQQQGGSHGLDDDPPSMTIGKEDCDALKSACHQKLVTRAGNSESGGCCHFTPSQEEALSQAVRDVFGSDDSDDDAQQPAALVAVRSSSPEEDLEGTSFAGGYETTLGVPLDTGAAKGNNNKNKEFSRALLTCFLSMLDYRVVSYKLQQQKQQKQRDRENRNSNGMDVVLVMDLLAPKIAVVVQEQIDSETSGVAFSINPRNNCYDEILITANFGLGESVVSGIVTPDVYTVERRGKKTDDGDDEKEEFVVLDRTIGAKQEAIWLKKNTKETDATGGTVTESIKDPSNEAALSEDQILELSALVARVEDVYSSASVSSSSSFCPVDVEWAYHGGTLYLLQARPVTSYLPLFPEMVTPRGASKKNLYMDLIVMTQGFSEPFSTLGLDVWKTVILVLKPGFFTNDGPTGAVWSLHGREYMHLSNMMKTTGGHALVDKMITGYDPSIARAIDTIDLADYTPDEFPEGVRGLLWRHLASVGKMVPALLSSWWYGTNAIDPYIEFSEAFVTDPHSHVVGDDLSSLVINTATMYEEKMRHVGAIFLSLWARYRLGKMFEGRPKTKDGENTEDLLISLCMDLKGNPTSEMGHAMVRMAGMPEIKDTETPEEFCKGLSEEGGSFSNEFRALYTDFMNRYGCRGMMEIDIASPRTSERPEEFFHKLRQIDTADNAIQKVTERRKDAHEKLLEIAKELGRESDFLYYDTAVHSFLGYREHPKYMIVFMNGLFRKRALAIGEEFVEKGWMDSKEDIFDLTLAQVASAQETQAGSDDGNASATTDLRPLIESNRAPSLAVAHVANWPTLIDSRGKIIRGTQKRPKSGDGGGGDDDTLGSILAVALSAVREGSNGGSVSRRLLRGHGLLCLPVGARFHYPCCC
mmetsp:Transcript_20628/g.43113  ORF Transcript_20628/g.43113 Transcript_20628/m.43113 type:complete len:966 (-) Transcript_20628:174-3071(-)